MKILERVKKEGETVLQESMEARVNNEVAPRSFMIPKKSPIVLVIIIVLNALPALATDMYLPALPSMSTQFDSPISLLNLNLVLFFLFYAIGLLLWGPLSDRYGRRPTLVTGMTAFVIFSVLCGLSFDVYQLIAFRALQGVFGGVAVAVSIAMIKDIYEGHKRERTYAIVSMMMAFGPILAPIAGAALLQYMTWRGIFYILGALGAVALLCCLVMEESLTEKSNRRILATLGQLWVVLKNKRYSRLLPSLSPLGMIIFVWVGISSYVLIDGFGLSQGEFSLFFACNAAFLVIGPFLYLFLAKRFDRLRIVTFSLATILLSGVLMILFGNLGPVPFLLSVIPATLSVSVIRTPSLDIVMSQMDTDAGSASSIFNFFFMAIGTLGMMIVSIEWENRILIAGLIFAIVGASSLGSWLAVYKHYVSKD
ncbi:MAG: multidrug effflux MFS transporter [Methanomassiliicoccales archaeon]|nr:multidrug effflux MFS transporter [Methanomassiliicoccales archaeon]